MAITNPYLADQANAITNKVNTNLMQQQLPSINRGAIAAGGFGGSRQGIAQGLAMNGANTAIADSLAGLYGNAYENDANRAQQMQIASMNDATQRYGLSNSYDLGLRNNALGNKQADQSFFLGNRSADNTALGLNQGFYTQQRGQDLLQQQQGFNQYLGSLNAQMGLGQSMYGMGQQQQNAPLQALQGYAGLISPFTGLNQSQTQSAPGTGGGLSGALGGALTMAQLWKLLNGS